MLSDAKRQNRACEKLVAAVLLTALRDLVGDSGIHSRTARRWIEDAEERPFGFRWCCDIAGVRPENLDVDNPNLFADGRKRVPLARDQSDDRLDDYTGLAVLSH
jgi:hypothetical protein